MRSSSGKVEKLRWLLLGGALLLAGALAALFGLANYRAGKVWQRILARNGVNLRRETNGVTWSQSEGGRTVFTLHASRATPRGDGKWALHDAMLILYGRGTGHADRIYGSEFEYDQKTGVARALGEVDMDLQTPGTSKGGTQTADLTFKPGNRTVDPTVLHVRTSGLVYVRKLDVAATDQPTEFRYKGLTCTSRGAEFDAGESTVRLLADVHLNGRLRDEPFALQAASATLNRETNIADLNAPQLTTAQRNARAAHAVLHLRKDGSVETGEAGGDVQLREGTRTVAAPQMAGVFDAQNRPQHAQLTGGVQFGDENRMSPLVGSARSAELAFTGAGQLATLTAKGAVTGTAKQVAPNGAPLAVRRLEAATAVADFAPRGKRSELQRLQLTGSAEFASETMPRVRGEQTAMTELHADELTTSFVEGQGGTAEPQHLSGVGHTTLRQAGATGGRNQSTGDALEATFAEGRRSAGAGEELQVSHAVQSGHVRLQSWAPPKAGEAGQVERTGRADQATFEEGANTLLLQANGGGRAQVSDGQSELFAMQIVLDQDTGNSEAGGDVELTLNGANGGPASHVLAERARLQHATDLSEFFGTDALPAKLFQGGSQVEGAAITVDGRHHTLSARPAAAAGAVHAVFAAERTKHLPAGSPARTSGRETGTASAGDVSEADRDAVRLSAARLDFNDLQHEATFAGGVWMQGASGEVRSERGVAFLHGNGAGAAPGKQPHGPAAAEAPLGGALDRLVMLGDVRIQQTGRSGVGEQLTYTAGTNSFVLTGTPARSPRMSDGQGGFVTGATLLFGAADSSIVVAGASGGSSGPSRVHTETDLKAQPSKQ